MSSRLVISVMISVFVAAGGAAADTPVQNPGFDGGLAGWMPAGDPSAIAAYSTEDAASNPSSGSVSVTNIYSGAGTAVTGYFQCIAITGGTEYRIGATVKIAPGQGVSGDAGVTGYWFVGAACDSYISGLSVHSATTGAWTPTDDFRTAPASAGSAGVYLNVYKLDSGGNLNALIDDVVFEAVLFRDGFENGDLLGWSGASP